MTFQEYASDHLGNMVLHWCAAAAASVFLLVTGTQAGILVLLMLLYTLGSVILRAVDFFRIRARLGELETILDGLEQKYLFAECAPIAGGIYERRLLELMRRSGKAMIGAVSDAQAAQREYREYIESWVHEIKAPMTAAQLICRNMDNGTRCRLTPELAQIEAHVERALFYARAESPEQDCVIRKSNLAEIVSEAIRNHQSLLIQSGMRVETKDLDTIVYTDSKWACFILGQLLQNAARYRGEHPAVTLSARTLGKQVQLQVQDNGIGIPSHELPRVFDRGFTGSNGRTRGGSTGMGLYLCRKLAHFLEIAVQITSVENEGTCVWLTFPAKETL